MSSNTYVITSDGLIVHTNGLPEVEARLLAVEAERIEGGATADEIRKRQVQAQQLVAAHKRNAKRQAAKVVQA